MDFEWDEEKNCSNFILQGAHLPLRRNDMNEAIDFSDIPELGDEFFSRAKKRGPLVQKNSVIVDRDVCEWFKANLPEPECSRMISQLLRNYMDEQQAKSAVLGGS